MAYHKIYTQQKGRDFVGMRDFYSLVKFIRTQMGTVGAKELDVGLLCNGLARNFSGKPELLDTILEVFHSTCFAKKRDKKKRFHGTMKLEVEVDTKVEVGSLPVPGVYPLIRDNLADRAARHLMVLTKNSSALPLLFGCGLLEEANTTLLIGSVFEEDQSELHLVRQINEVKLALARVLILVITVALPLTLLLTLI